MKPSKDYKPPEEIRDLWELRLHLCNMAVSGSGRRIIFHPENCQRCVSPCGYGDRLLELKGMDRAPRNKKKSPFWPVTAYGGTRFRDTLRRINKTPPSEIDPIG